MTTEALILLLLKVLLLLIIILVVALVVYTRTKKKEKIKVNVRRKNDFLFNSYLFFSKFPLTKRYMIRIKRRIEIIELADNWTVNRKAMRFAYISIISSAALLLFLFSVSNTLYFLLISFFTIYIIHNQIQNIFFEKIRFKILIQFERFMGNVRHHYHEHGMIDEAIYDSTEECAYEMSLHATKMYEILTSTDIEGEIEKYYEVVPNKFFKTFLALCYTVQKFGDKLVDNQSIFLTNLNYLKQEINLEILRINKLNYLFKSLSIIAILPIFFIKPLESWAMVNIPDLGKYFEGSYGFVIQILIFFIVLLSYQLVIRMQKNNEENAKTINIEGFLLKIPFIDYLVDKLVNRNYSRSVRLSEFLKSTNSQININHFYVRRILVGGLGFIVSVIAFINIHNLNKNSILEKIDQQSLQAYNNVKNSDELISELIEFDKGYVLKFKNSNITYDELEDHIKDTSSIKKGQLVTLTTKRILSKINQYSNQYFKWWELLLSICIGALLYNVPSLLLLYKKKIMQMDMEDEVMQFHTIILMLMYIEQITVDDILQWMEQFSFIFKNSIGKCLNDFENGDLDALEQLKIDEPFVPFARIVDNLQLASDKIAIVQAFDELRIERNYYQEKRKQDNEIIINKKGIWGKLIAFVPMGALLLLYLLVPFVMVSIEQFKNYNEQVSGML